MKNYPKNAADNSRLIILLLWVVLFNMTEATWARVVILLLIFVSAMRWVIEL